MQKTFHFIFALAVILILCLLVSRDRQYIRPRYIIQLLIIEIGLGWLLLNSDYGLRFVTLLTDGFQYLLQYAGEGTDFVFGGMRQENLAFFFLQVLCPIVFVSALIGILQHIRLLPFIIETIGTLLSKINGMGKLESFNAISSLLVGQSENFIAYRTTLNQMSQRQIYTLAATAMSTVSMAIVGAYMTKIEPRYVVAALVLNMFSTFIVMSVINPYPADEGEFHIEKRPTKQSFFEMLGEYILVGFRVAIIVSAMLIGFVALIACLNGIFTAIFDKSFQQLLGYLFYPVAWITGVPAHEAVQAASIMATKMVSNEFVAMIDLHKRYQEFSPQTQGILSIFLVSFANFSSIGIVAGAIKGIDEKQGDVVSRMGLKLLYGSTLVSVLSASVAGLIL